MRTVNILYQGIHRTGRDHTAVHASFVHCTGLVLSGRQHETQQLTDDESKFNYEPTATSRNRSRHSIVRVAVPPLHAYRRRTPAKCRTTACAAQLLLQLHSFRSLIACAQRDTVISATSPAALAVG
jgi:hypothetical protein